ncbi:MAG TPA: bifunctional 3,4-dihydroxy-2-butanone-4-phosphate synthase/GTP cyclohydrolase II [Burkholderiales bacterium]|nr:bifunctional 3,4-dihydroxy-2-butanone-4-phosphate synthase/GTP cyclohydrolase II [Burkholderiales bacterium]
MRRETTAISPTAEIVADIKSGRMVILVDEEDRENEGDLVVAAEHVTPEAINFMAKHARGLVCLTLTEERRRQLDLPPMVRDNRSPMGTNFTVSIEAAEGVSTGISAHDRARTVRAAVAKDARPADIVQPGHVFPVVAQPGGVLVRAGHTEAGCDLAQLAGLTPAAVICEVMHDDGSMARLPQLIEFAASHGLKIGTIADLIEYRSATESLVRRSVERDIVTAYGDFRMVAYRDLPTGGTHLALVHGEIRAERETLVRVHEPLSLVDLLDAGPGTHSWTIREALSVLARASVGVVVLLNCAQDDEALEASLRAADAEARPARRDSRSTDLRTYGIGAQILRDLGVGKMRLMAAPRKMPSMAGFGLEVTGYADLPRRGG